MANPTVWKFLLHIALLPGMLSTNYRTPVQASDSTREYTWTQLTSSAEFPKSYNFQLFADRNIIRAFHPSGLWESSDGKSWSKTALEDIVKNQAFLDYVKFKGSIYALGTFEGNIERFTQTGQIARTRDFRNWEILSRDSNLPRRYFYHPFVFQGRLWIVGGEDPTGKYDDAWVSADAVHWTKIAENLPFGKRAGQRFVVFKDNVYMLDHDVWVSADGLEWRRLTPQIAEGNIFGYAVEVLDNRVWLIGCSRSGAFRSEVLSSTDWITWKPEEAPWSPRGGTATCVFKDQIIMTGGKYGGPGIEGQTEFVYSNDVWAFGRTSVVQEPPRNREKRRH